MGYKLCTAEKFSVAQDIARVIGASQSHKGYFEGNGYIVTWAIGHLVGLAEPEEYGYLSKEQIYKQKDIAYEQLPILPKEWKLIVLEKTAAQFEIVKGLMHRPDVDYIIDCGDMGPEGHILQWFIREKAGCTKPVKRFCATSMTDEAIKDAMGKLRDASDFMPVIRGEFCKKKADWMLGLSLSRAESLKYGTQINVGRVQSPTLAFVVNRYLEVRKFKATDYYTLSAIVDSAEPSFKIFWKADKQGLLPRNLVDGENRCLDKTTVRRMADDIIRQGTGKVIAVSCKKRGTERPQLYDIIELQRDANKRFGYSAAVTLAAAQALYQTQKVLSYPRTDSRYLTSDLSPYLVKTVESLSTIEKYKIEAERAITRGLNIDKRIVDDSKVTDHHALIPTSRIRDFDPNKMEPTAEEKRAGVTSEIMRDVLDLVLSRLLVALAPIYTYEQTDVTVEVAGGFHLTASGKKPLQYGWKAVQDCLLGKGEKEEDNGEDEQLFPALAEGQTVNISSCEVVSKKTTPPQLHTEASLLKEMQNAGQKIENGAILKGRGIGTQATRAEIIKGLFDTGVVENQGKGKTTYIVPTAKGLAVMRVLPPELYSAQITADWENKIALIVEGKLTEEQFLNDFIRFLCQKTDEIKAAEKADISFAAQREVFAECPWCGSPVYKWQGKSGEKITKTRYYCGGKCGLSIDSANPVFLSRMGRNLTAAEIKRLLEKGNISTKQCKSKAGGTYSGKFLLRKKDGVDRDGNPRKYADIEFEFTKSR